MSTRVTRSSAAKKTSSWVRPGVCEVLARPLRLVSALMRLDLPTFERPTKAISLPLMAGSDAAEPAAPDKAPFGCEQPGPGSHFGGGEGERGHRSADLRCQAGPLTPGLLFFLNRLLMASHPSPNKPLIPRPASLRLSSNSILAAWRRMMTDCWITDSVLFHAQYITSPDENDASMKVKITGIQSNMIF